MGTVYGIKIASNASVFAKITFCLLVVYSSFAPMASMFSCFSMTGAQEGYISMFPARLCFSLILSPITNLSLHET